MSTTVRNIERIPQLLELFIKLEKNNENIYEINGNRNPKSYEAKINLIKKIISIGFISSNKVNDEILNKIQNGELLSKNEVEIFMKQAPQTPGWSGRFSNYMNKLESLGFAFRNPEEGKIEVTKLGKLFIKKPQLATIWSLANIPSNNYFSRRKNSFTPLGIIAQYLKKYKTDKISKNKLAALISIRNFEDFEKIDFANSNGWQLAKSLVDEDIKIKDKTFADYENELGMTLKFAGLFISDFNGYKATKFLLSNLEIFLKIQKDAVKKYKNINEYSKAKEYVDNAILEDISPTEEENNQVKIRRIAKNFTYKQLCNWIIEVVNREPYNIPNVLPKIKRYVIIEWLVSILLAKNPRAEINTYMNLDFEGYPISHAPGGKADIVSKINKKLFHFEVTLITNQKQMENSETTSVSAHAKDSNANAVYLVAPKVHSRVKEYFAFVENQSGIIMKTITFDDLINKKYLTYFNL